MKVIFEDIEVKIIETKKRGLSGICRNCEIMKKIRMLLNKKMRVRKLFIGFIVAALIFAQSPYPVLAITIPTAPTAPTAPIAPEEPDTTIEEPTAPDDAPDAPDAPEAPSEPGTLGEEESTDEERTRDYEERDRDEEDDSLNDQESEEQIKDVVAAVSVEENETGGRDDGGNVGDTTIDTGDADIEGAIVTDANENFSVSFDDSDGGIEVANTGNGADSENSGSVVIDDINDTVQLNDAMVTNEIGLGAVTGDNESSKNVGNTTINTGDANTTGTIVNAINTNIDGIMVNEFNIVDDHMGDYVLDFSTGCVSGCSSGVSVENEGNGTKSLNSGDVDVTDADNTFQANDATIVNDMVLYSNSGDNEADKNTGGDSGITTGDANVNANILNFANNNLAGDVIYAVVNIFGDLIGDIILPDGSLLSAAGSDTKISNTGNGSESVNSGEVTEKNTDNIAQFNTVDIDNNLIIDANTGNNETSDNTGGTNSIKTGDADVLAQIVNVANMNLVGGNWWLVIVNDAGNWIGKIIGSPDGSNMAASSGLEFVVDDSGEIAVVNSDNGSGSENTGSVSTETANNITQTNNASIVNNVDLSANTGGNSASKNTNGDSTITTGDVNIVTNIVNFVNNNIVGTGRLFVTMVNVFGSWFGDFVGSGYTKEIEQTAVGGVADAASNNNSSVSSSNSSDSNSSGQTASSEVSADILIASDQANSQGVLGLFINNGNGSSGDDDSDNSSGISGITGGSDDGVMGQRAINVNLAWALLAIPFAGILMVIKKRFVLLNWLPKKNLGNA